jgi:hypothetical protein
MEKKDFYFLSGTPKVKKEWHKRRSHMCKPCWELKYCPYGPLVEIFPLLGPTRKEAIEHNEFLKEQLKKNAYDPERTKEFKKQIKAFDAKRYPVSHSNEEVEKSCSIFGHQCPVFLVNEPFTETAERRRITRHIPRETMLRVVRRDNYTCQMCGKYLSDSEIEFDHVIPLSKGGSTEENNLRLTCVYCNRKKSSKVPQKIKGS